MLDKNVTLLFGMGAGKAGTTWLHSYLSSHPECACPSVKEVNYFSQLYLPEFSKRQRKMAKKYRRHRWSLPLSFGALHEKNRRELEYYEFISDADLVRDTTHSKYLEFLASSWQGEPVISDITPSYALLGRDRIAEMASVIPHTKFVFSMRDPVERLWSYVKTQNKRKGRNKRKARLGGNFLAQRLMDRILDSGPAKFPRNSDYCFTVTELDAAVPQSDLLYQFTETVFESGNVDALTEFLGIRPFAADTGTRVNPGRRFGLDDERVARACRYLADQYRFIFDRFGDTVPQVWRERYDLFC